MIYFDAKRLFIVIYNRKLRLILVNVSTKAGQKILSIVSVSFGLFLARPKWRRVAPACFTHRVGGIGKSACAFVALGLLIFSGPFNIGGQTYEVEGTLHSKAYIGKFPFKIFNLKEPDAASVGAATLPTIDETWHFQLLVSNCEWFLHEVPEELKFGGILQTNNFDYVEASFDGVQYYVVCDMEDNYNRMIDKVANQDRSAQNVAQAVIGIGAIPADTGSHVPDLWLGFASHCYFESLTNDCLYPIFMKRADALVFHGAVKCALDYLPNNKYLPLKIIYTRASAGEPGISAQDLDHFGTNAMFTLDTYTNFGGAIIPTHYFVRNYSMAGVLTVESEVVAGLRFDSAGPANFIPRLPGNSYITDLRFPSVGAYKDAYYLASNWPAAPKVEKIYQAELKQNERQEDYKKFMASSRREWNHRIRLAVLVITGVGSLVPIFLFCRSKQIKQ